MKPIFLLKLGFAVLIKVVIFLEYFKSNFLYKIQICYFVAFCDFMIFKIFI